MQGMFVVSKNRKGLYKENKGKRRKYLKKLLQNKEMSFISGKKQMFVEI